MKIVLISPHRDDAAFSLGLSIEKWLRDHHTVTVVNCFTRSEYAPYSEIEYMHPNDRMPRVSAIRLREDHAWQRLYPAGLTLIDLNLKDAPLRRHCSADAVCALGVDLSDKAILKVAKAVAREQPGALLLPLALGSHVDHLTVRDALAPLAQTALPVAFYEDLPYAARSGVLNTLESAVGALDPLLAPAFAGAPTVVDEAISRKRRLALSYDSQINTEVTEQIAQFCARYEGRERLWTNAAWRGSALFQADPSPQTSPA